MGSSYFPVKEGCVPCGVLVGEFAPSMEDPPLFSDTLPEVQLAVRRSDSCGSVASCSDPILFSLPCSALTSCAWCPMGFPDIWAVVGVKDKAV